MLCAELTPLSREVSQAHLKLTQLISQVPASFLDFQQIEFTAGSVSVRDIISYQLGWGRLLISWYEAGLQRRVPEMPGEGFTKWDYVGLARHFYKKYRYDRLEEQLDKWEKVVQKIIKIIENESLAGNLEKVDVWQWCTLPSGVKWPLSKWIRVNTVSPYKRAAAAIRKYIGQLHMVEEGI